MSEELGDQRPEDRGIPPVEPQLAAIDETLPAGRAEAATHTPAAARFRQAASWPAALLVLVIAAVALSPFWAPAMAPLLPWGAKSAPVAADDAALAARVTALEARPAPATVDLDPIRSALAAQAQRIDRLQAALAAQSQDQAAAAADKTVVQQLTRRVAAIEAQAAAQAASRTAESGRLEQELARLGSAANERLSALEHRVSAQGSTDRTGTALLLAMLQMREAIEEAHPFPAAYDAFKGLAGDDAALLAGAAPLAPAARDGVASRAVLRAQLDSLGSEIARSGQPAGKRRWWEQALDRIRQLVKIRRIGAAAHTSPEAAVSAAQSALAAGNLAPAVSALGSLSGADAELAQPWLRLARDRLAAEAALARLQELLAARLGAAAMPSPAAPPANPPLPTPRAPS
jgi:hypothetical protein